MGKIYEGLDDDLRDFIRRQHVFFVGTAPSALDGHLNLSPKGLDTLQVLGPTTVAYLDLIGSGIETVAHLRENGRLTILFCAFEGRPLVLRLHGRGRVVEPADAGWDGLAAAFPAYESVRAVVVLDVERISTSCGFGVPLYEYRGDRPQLLEWADRKGRDALEQYKARNNARSIDGLDGLRDA
jgi:hypothetical protein